MISAVLLGLAALVVTGCSCGRSEPESPAGKYELSAMVTEGKETAPEDIELLKKKGLDCTLTLEADGTGILDLFGEETAVTWDEETVSAGDKTMPYIREDKKITLTDGESSLTFSLVEE